MAAVNEKPLTAAAYLFFGGIWLGFSEWIQNNSGYTPHPLLHKDLLKQCLCGETPLPDTRVVELSGSYVPVSKCSRCGRIYAQLPDGFFPLENPLRFRILEADSGGAGD